MSSAVPLLRLKAVDDGDLAVMSGALQDAIVPIGDIAYSPGDRQFMMAANRYRWEIQPPDATSGQGERVNCAVTVSNVIEVKRRGINLGDRSQFLNLLSVTCTERTGEAGMCVDFTFSGHAAIRLETTELLCHLEDFGEPWPTQWRPRHADD